MVPRTMREGAQVVMGERFLGVQRTPHRNAAGRVCAESGCTTLLSIYNDGEFCAAHAPLIVPILRGTKHGRGQSETMSRAMPRAKAS
jgi:hypothetical protein